MSLEQGDAALGQAGRHNYPIGDAVRTEVLCNYQPQDGDAGQLRLSKGDIVWVLERHESGWWGGHKEGDDLTGWFPSKLVRPTTPGDDSGAQLDDSLVDPLRTSDGRMVASPQVGHHRRMAASEDAAELAEARSCLEVAQQEIEAERLRAKEASAAALEASRRLAVLEAQAAMQEQQVEALRQELAKREQHVQQERQQWAEERQHLHARAQERDAERAAYDAEVRKLQDDIRRREGELDHHRAQLSAFEEQRVGRTIVREVSLGASAAGAASRESSLVRESSVGAASIQRRLFADGPEQPHTASYVPQPVPRGPPAAVVNASVMPPASMATQVAAMPAQMAAAVPTIPSGSAHVLQPQGTLAGSFVPPLSSRHTVPTNGHGQPQPHVQAAGPPPGQLPRPSPRNGSYVASAPSPAATRAASASGSCTVSVPSSPALRVRDVQAEAPKREVRSLVAAYERRSGSAAPAAHPAAVLAPARPAEASPVRQQQQRMPPHSRPGQAMGSCLRTASREAPPQRRPPPPGEAAAESERTPRAHGGEEQLGAVNFGMSPMHKVPQRSHMSRTASPARAINSSPSPGKAPLSVQDRIHFFQAGRPTHF
mmetsp:Transcript_8442/g.23712  ORF Transcript_8442/g.23712 Transcript_8442/m.23712 type:complete len:599 (-) Transcript_8442:100-1896(-)